MAANQPQSKNFWVTMFGGFLDGERFLLRAQPGHINPPATLRVDGIEHLHVYHVVALGANTAWYRYKRAESKSYGVDQHVEHR